MSSNIPIDNKPIINKVPKDWIKLSRVKTKNGLPIQFVLSGHRINCTVVSTVTQPHYQNVNVVTVKRRISLYTPKRLRGNPLQQWILYEVTINGKVFWYSKD